MAFYLTLARNILLLILIILVIADNICRRVHFPQLSGVFTYAEIITGICLIICYVASLFFRFRKK
jgi:hypothetical protein